MECVDFSQRGEGLEPELLLVFEVYDERDQEWEDEEEEVKEGHDQEFSASHASKPDAVDVALATMVRDEVLNTESKQ